MANDSSSNASAGSASAGNASAGNPFEQLAAEQMTAPNKRKLERRQARIVRSEADAPMKLSAQEQQLADQSKQMRVYRAWKKSEYDAVKHHPVYAKKWADLVDRVAALPDGADEFPAYLADQAWLLNAEMGIRRLALSFIADRLIRIRLERGLSPCDDSLPFSDEPPTLFETVRDMLRTMTA
jgi:hypothetical protein